VEDGGGKTVLGKNSKHIESFELASDLTAASIKISSFGRVYKSSNCKMLDTSTSLMKNI